MPYIKGSVIPFITIYDVRKRIMKSCVKYDGRYRDERFQVLKKLKEAEENFNRQALKLKDFRILMLRPYLPQ